ncbi:MAG: hypothetical protein GC191_04990 [Azospirillum sp.]|nr:hypothetical protein [Azospirillum sp.]
MVSSINPILGSGTGVSSLLTAAGGASSVTGLLYSAGGSGSALFAAITPTGGSVTDSALNNQQIQLQKNNILTQASARLDYILSGQLEAKSDWEKIGAYYTKTGQPFILELNSRGQIQASGQADPASDLSRFSPQEQAKLLEATDQLSVVMSKVEANTKNNKLIDNLEGSTVLLDALSLGTTPKSDWERQALNLMQTKTPFRMILNSAGELAVQDQTKATFSDYPPFQRNLLLKAAATIRTAIQTGVGYNPSAPGNQYQLDAKQYADAGQNFYLDIDPVHNTIIAKKNLSSNVVPSFLRQPPYADVGDDASWKEDAIAFQKAGRAFHLDISNSGQITAKENTAVNLVNYTRPRYGLSTTAPAILSLLA